MAEKKHFPTIITEENRHGNTFDLAACPNEPSDLSDSGFSIAGIGSCHGLHAHRRAPPDSNRADLDLMSLFALYHAVMHPMSSESDATCFFCK